MPAFATDPRELSLAEIPGAVTEQLAEYVGRRTRSTGEIDPSVGFAVELLQAFVLSGGKRIRPLYAWAGYVGSARPEVSSEDPYAVLRAVSSLELIQACALIHDDIVDGSDTRRGRPTVHRQAEARHRELGWSGDAAKFGESIAILVGDLALAWAEDMLQDSGLSPAALARIRDPWRAMRTEVISGQILDISAEAARETDPQVAEKINRYKTAAYTIERPLHLGATIANAPERTIAAFRAYGHDIGVAFQLRDDELGVFGDPAVTGKPAGDDLREGKRTVLVNRAIALSDRGSELDRELGRTADPARIAALTGIIRDSGALDEVERRIAELTASGLSHLDQASLPDAVTETLRGLAIKATERRS